MKFVRNIYLIHNLFAVNGVIAFALSAFAFITQQWYVLIFLLILLPLVIVFFVSNNEFITINEEGISCYKSEKRQWFCSWDDIEFLRISTLANAITVDIVKRNEAITQEEKINTVWYYFQLSSSARKAIKKYCTRPVLNKTLLKNIMGQWDGYVIQGQGQGYVVPSEKE